MTTTEEKFIDQEVGILVLEQGETEDGQTFWALISVRPSQYEAFQKAKEKGGYVLTDYADVLRYELGQAEPTVEVLQEMADQFGFQA